MQRDADTYAAVTDRAVLPAFDFIATIADAAPGKDGDYSAEVQPEDVQRYLDAARRKKMLFILDFQPGKADVLAQVKRYERFLLQPDVGLALDPEWVLPADKKRFNDIGHMDARTINNVSSYLANLTLKNRLPEKLFMLHQFRVTMIPKRELVVDRPGLATIIHSDGHGDRKTKLKVYDVLATTPPLGTGMSMGIKIFPKHPDVPKARLKYTDTNIFSPADVLGPAAAAGHGLHPVGRRYSVGRLTTLRLPASSTATSSADSPYGTVNVPSGATSTSRPSAVARCCTSRAVPR